MDISVVLGTCLLRVVLLRTFSYVSLVPTLSFLLGIYLQVELLGYRACSALEDTDKSLPIVVSPIDVLRLHGKCMRTPIAPHRGQLLVLSVFSMSAIWVDMQWQGIVLI